MGYDGKMAKKSTETETEDPIETAPESEIETTKKDQKKKEDIEELTDMLKRLQAEFENYKKRSEKENSILIKHSNAELIKELLPVLDSFELAIKNTGTENPEIIKYKKGLELIFTQLFSILKDEGLRPIEIKDQKFDPYKHEVLMIKETGQEDDMVLEEFQKGYMLNDTVLRHTKVMISKHKTENNQ